MFNLKTILTIAVATSSLLGVAMVKPSFAGEYSSKGAYVGYESSDTDTHTKTHNVKYVGYDNEQKYKDDDDYGKGKYNDYGNKYHHVNTDRNDWKPAKKCPQKAKHHRGHNRYSY